METPEIVAILRAEGVRVLVCDWADGVDAVITPGPPPTCYVARRALTYPIDEQRAIAWHEIGHLRTNSFYRWDAPAEERAACERVANQWAQEQYRARYAEDYTAMLQWPEQNAPAVT